MKSAFSNWFGDFSFESSDEPLWNFKYSHVKENKTFIRSKSVSVIVEGGELRGEILVFKIRKEEYGKKPTVSYEIQTRAFGESTSTYCTENLLIEGVKSAEDRLVETLKKGPQPTILDELTKLGYK